MPGWIIQALRILALGFGGGAAFEYGSRVFDPTTVGPGITSRLTGGRSERIIEGVGGVFGMDKPKRRRRRRALTASDRADIAFIVGLLGPTAGKNFAVTLAGRTR